MNDKWVKVIIVILVITLCMFCVGLLLAGIATYYEAIWAPKDITIFTDDCVQTFHDIRTEISGHRMWIWIEGAVGGW